MCLVDSLIESLASSKIYSILLIKFINFHSFWVKVNEIYMTQFCESASIWLIELHSFSDKPKTQRVSQPEPSVATETAASADLTRLSLIAQYSGSVYDPLLESLNYVCISSCKNSVLFDPHLLSVLAAPTNICTDWYMF